MEPTWTAAERAEFDRLNAGAGAPKGASTGTPVDLGRKGQALRDAVLNIGRKGQALTPVGASPPPAVTAEQRKQRLAQVPMWNRADGVDYAVMATSGLLTGLLTGSLGRRIDVPWYLGALGGLGLGAALGLTASVKLRSDRK
jgi:hypothetical protein